MPPQTHNTTLYHPPLARDAASVMREDARTAQFHHWTSRDSDIPRGVAPEPEYRGWQGHDRDHMFWIHESPPSSVSQDGTSNASSESHSSTAGSAEGPAEERRGRTVSPYGSFFAEEMEFDYGPPADVESSSFYWGDRRERDTVLSDMNGALRYRATRRIPRSQSSRWTTNTNPRTRVPVAQMEPALFVAGYPVYARPPVAVPAPEGEALSSPSVVEASLSRLSLAENSRQSQPPVSWRHGQGYYLDHPNSPRSHYSWCEPPRAATTSPPGRPLSSHDRRQMQGMAPGRRRK